MHTQDGFGLLASGSNWCGTVKVVITALTFLFKARDLSEKTFKAHFHVVPRAHHKLHLSASSFSRGPMAWSQLSHQSWEITMMTRCDHVLDLLLSDTRCLNKNWQYFLPSRLSPDAAVKYILTRLKRLSVFKGYIRLMTSLASES